MDNKINSKEKEINKDKKELLDIFDRRMNRIKFNYPTYRKHIKEMLSVFIEQRIKKIEKEEYSMKNINGETINIQYSGFSFVDELEDEVIDEYKKIKPSLIIFKEKNQIFKKYSEDLLKTKKIEQFTDIIAKILRLHKGEKLLNSILSNKYKKIIKTNKKEYENLINLYCKLNEKKITETQLQQELGGKLASIKSYKEFYERSAGILNGFSKTYVDILSKIEEQKLNAKIIKKDLLNNLLIVSVKDYEASNKLCSKSWCIQYNRNYFKQHITNEKIDLSDFNNIQLIIWDFNKKETDKRFMYGITIDIEYKIKAAHFSDNSKCSQKELMQTFPEIFSFNYWDWETKENDILVKKINDSDLKRNVKLDLLIKYAKDDIHIYKTYEYLKTRFRLEDAQPLWLDYYKKLWTTRVKDSDLESKKEYLKNLNSFFSEHELYEKYFNEIEIEANKSILKN